MGNFRGVRATQNGTIEITFQFHGQRCRERIALVPSPTNLRRASEHRATILAAIRDGSFDYATTFPNSKRAERFRSASSLLRDYLPAWLERQKPKVAASTYRDYRKTVDILIGEFGSVEIGGIERAHVWAWVDKLDCSQKRISNLVSPLRIALHDAMVRGIIADNPLDAMKIKVERKQPKVEPEPFSQDERVAILKALDGQGYTLILFALWTGLRTSELVALDWSDIDWVGERVFVSRAWTQAGEVAEGTKTAAGTREVRLLPEALRALQQQRQHTYLKGEEVFQNPATLERWQGDQPIRKTLWTYALKRAGVRYRNPYQTRHTYASMMLMAGEPVQWVSTQLGHKSWEFTARTYTRWIPSDATESGSRAAAKWSTAVEK